MDRLADKRDPLLLKIVRNISQWTFNQQEVQYVVCVLVGNALFALLSVLSTCCWTHELF